MFNCLEDAHSAAVKQNLAHGCVVHINVVIEKRVVSDGTGIQHYVSGYTLSDWSDGTTIHSVVK